MKNVIESIWSHWIVKAAISLGAFFYPTVPMLSGVIALVVIDAVTGMIAARARGEKLCSKAFSRSVPKLLIYIGAVLVGFIAQKLLTGEMIPLCNFVASWVGLTEGFSCLENLNTISGNQLLQDLLNKMRLRNQIPPEQPLVRDNNNETQTAPPPIEPK